MYSTPLRTTIPPSRPSLFSYTRLDPVSRGKFMSRSRAGQVPTWALQLAQRLTETRTPRPFLCAHSGLLAGMQIRGGEARRCERGLTTSRRTAAKHRQRSQDATGRVQGTPRHLCQGVTEKTRRRRPQSDVSARLVWWGPSFDTRVRRSIYCNKCVLQIR